MTHEELRKMADDWSVDPNRFRNDVVNLLDEIERYREVIKMVDQWGNGLRHHTAHESKMVKAARAVLQKKEGKK